MSLLGIDLGTTGCKAGVFDLAGHCLAEAYREYDMLHPQPGWAELDSVQVWQRTREIISEVAARSGADPVTALSVSAFGEAFVPVSRNRDILGTSILCVDDRGKEHTDRLLCEFGEERFYRINPNLLGPNFALPKLLWMREHRTGVFERADYFLLWSDFVAFMLGCEPVTNNSHANRTLLFDLDRNDWSDELLAWSGISRARLGRVVCGGEVIGTVSNAMAMELGLPANVQVVAGGHDQCCNALGCGAIQAGSTVCGMGSFECLTPVYRKPDDPLRLLHERLNIEHHVLPDLYLSFLYNQSGLLVKWFRDTFAAADSVEEGGNLYDRLTAEMPADPTRLLVLPHFDPPPWPRYISDTSGMIVGLKTDTTRGEILKAIMESTTLYFVDSIDALKQVGARTESFTASGGGAKSDAWLQIKADIFGVPFIRPRITEGGLLGAAMLAGIATGVLGSAEEAADVFVQQDRVFEPDTIRHAAYLEQHDVYRQLFDTNRELLRRL